MNRKWTDFVAAGQLQRDREGDWRRRNEKQQKRQRLWLIFLSEQICTKRFFLFVVYCRHIAVVAAVSFRMHHFICALLQNHLRIFHPCDFFLLSTFCRVCVCVWANDVKWSEHRWTRHDSLTMLCYRNVFIIICSGKGIYSWFLCKMAKHKNEIQDTRERNDANDEQVQVWIPRVELNSLTIFWFFSFFIFRFVLTLAWCQFTLYHRNPFIRVKVEWVKNRKRDPMLSPVSTKWIFFETFVFVFAIKRMNRAKMMPWQLHFVHAKLKQNNRVKRQMTEEEVKKVFFNAKRNILFPKHNEK